MEGGRLVAPFDPSAPVSRATERFGRGGLMDASDLEVAWAALAGPGAAAARGLTAAALHARLRAFHPDAARAEADFLMPADGGLFTRDYLACLLETKVLTSSFDPLAEALRAFAAPEAPAADGAAVGAGAGAGAAARAPPALAPAALARVAEGLRLPGHAALADAAGAEAFAKAWDADADGALGLEDVRAALRAARGGGGGEKR
jgi:hypothetical protein